MTCMNNKCKISGKEASKQGNLSVMCDVCCLKELSTNNIERIQEISDISAY